MALNRFSNMMVENVRFVKGRTLLVPASETYNLIKIPRNGFVFGVWLEVLTVFNGSTPATCSVGFVGNGESADPDAFLDTAAGLLTTVGMISSTSDAQPASDGKYFEDASGIITATVVINDSTAGAFRVWAAYSVVW